MKVRAASRVATFGAVLAIAAMGLAACGGSAQAGASSKASTSSSKAPINIGIVCSCTGPLASSTAIGPPGFEAWAKYQNAHGGVNGHQVHVILKNDAFNPGTALSDVEQFVTQDHIVALVDGSDVDSSFATYIKSHNIPVIGGGSQSTLDLTNSDWFAPGETLDEYFVNYVEMAKKVKADNIGELYCAESVICQQGVAPFEATAKKLDLKVGYVASISASAPSYTAQCLAAQQAGVNVLLVADAVSVVQAVAKDCTAQGYHPYEMAIDGAIAKSFPSAPGIENHFIGAETDLPFFVDTTPASKTMIAALKKYEPSTYNSPNYGEETTQFWVTGLLFDAAAKAGKAGVNGPVTSAEIYKGLYSLHNETLDGMAPPLNYKKGVPNPVNCWYWVSIKDGKFTTPYGIKPVCVTPPPVS